IDEIRAEFPDYAGNMKDEMLGASPVDGKNYSVPVNGYWEGLFVNKKVLADCGLEVPTAATTWDEFMEMCKTIAAKGYSPIACSLQEVPHYWFEYTVFNEGNLKNHTAVPAASTDEAGMKWAKGLNTIKTMYEANCFPVNTLTAGDADTFQLMADNKAAFAIDGSWKLGWFADNAADINDFTVTYVPGKAERKTTDLVGGLSMGYYITRKAWDDPEKREAAVKFVQAMTTDEVVNTFGATAITALKNGTIAPADANVLVSDALALTKGATGIAAAAEDGLNSEARAALFADVKNVATGKTTAEAAIDACLAVK
ncbi:MAG: extracellular solute-binding protein, partial [Ruthenibacterium sp.]